MDLHHRSLSYEPSEMLLLHPATKHILVLALDLGFHAILSLPVPPACGGRSVACPRARFPHVDRDGADLLDAGVCVVIVRYSSGLSTPAF